MNFLELMEVLGYKLKEKTDVVFALIKEDESDDIILIFNKPEKIIHGYIKNKKLIHTLDDVSHLYAQFQQMEKDAKRFANFIKYEVV